jgi:hypothetical protein
MGYFDHNQTGGGGQSLTPQHTRRPVQAGRKFFFKERRKCEVAGCENVAVSKGGGRYRRVCGKHRRATAYRLERARNRPTWRGRVSLVGERCERCGEEGGLERHRIKGSGGYRRGDIEILCVECSSSGAREEEGRWGILITKSATGLRL